METRIVYRDSGGIRRTSITDSEKPFQLRVHTEADMEQALEEVKRARELVRPGSANKLLAKVPMTVVEQSIHEQWDEGDWVKWLNDPDNKEFRVWQGRV